MGNGTDRVQKELKFKQLYKQYYVPFCLYAKRYVNDISVKSVNRYKQKTLEILRSELKDYLPLLLLLIHLG